MRDIIFFDVLGGTKWELLQEQDLRRSRYYNGLRSYVKGRR